MDAAKSQILATDSFALEYLRTITDKCKYGHFGVSGPWAWILALIGQRVLDVRCTDELKRLRSPVALHMMLQLDMS